MRYRVCLTLLVSACAALPAAAQEKGKFPDVPAVHYAFDAVYSLAQKDVIRGYPDGRFQGRRALTRYELAQGLARFDVEVKRQLSAITIHPRLGGLQGPRGPVGPKGAPGAQGPEGPRGQRPSEFDELQREQARQREDVTRLQEQFRAFPSQLPKSQVQDLWGQLETLDRRIKRAAKPIPGILR